MKKTFTLVHPKKKPARVVDAIKSEVKKYIKRERNKQLPKDSNYWAFDCKFGLTEQDAQAVHQNTISKKIDGAVAAGHDSFYIEIIARADFRARKIED
ncbi:DUF6172 family protein [Bermanella sp. WJH001]|uniref:DUF6172 family protein n=1 Tax=Bermanella sp. WJH001 TaxID=3048005 RepID=UPI0024BDE2EF|nr:DUF6172 family protein [Bermanella sp. WJH001]MDJ1539129.1 DUF6172 family protein [Bermanella sp. WJH001]